MWPGRRGSRAPSVLTRASSSVRQFCVSDQRRRARPRGKLVTAGLIRAHRARPGVTDARVLPVCGSGILYDARVPGHDEHFVFGSSGFVHRSNKLIYDQATHSLWSQFTGWPVVGPLTGLGIELAVLPVTIASWRDWRARHPTTKMLSLDTNCS
jgi:Protein of unknown function (DUF3179)